MKNVPSPHKEFWIGMRNNSWLNDSSIPGILKFIFFNKKVILIILSYILMNFIETKLLFFHAV